MGEKEPCIQDKVRKYIWRASEKTPGLLITIILCIGLITATIWISIKSGNPFYPMDIIVIASTIGTLSIGAYQYLINRSLLRIERQRSQPFLYAEISSDKPRIFIENRGGGIAWGCIITLSRGDIDEVFNWFFEEVYPWSGEEIEIPIEWQTQSFDLCIEIDYYKKKEIHPDSKEHWERIFRKIKPFYDY